MKGKVGDGIGIRKRILPEFAEETVKWLTTLTTLILGRNPVNTKYQF